MGGIADRLCGWMADEPEEALRVEPLPVLVGVLDGLAAGDGRGMLPSIGDTGREGRARDLESGLRKERKDRRGAERVLRYILNERNERFACGTNLRSGKNRSYTADEQFQRKGNHAAHMDGREHSLAGVCDAFRIHPTCKKEHDAGDAHQKQADVQVVQREPL